MMINNGPHDKAQIHVSAATRSQERAICSRRLPCSQYCGGPIPQRRANVLQVWPQHGPLESLRPEEFNPRIEALATRHCK
ncbi:hypothetical protein F4W70_27925 [Pseudomonas cannabina]|nr:hypothetical protein F4W70_27925 [Pseudomonas cannabina]